MKFLSIKAENFLSFHSLNYSFPETGLYFIGGEKYDSKISNSNGSGKSAFVEILAWTLFGNTIRNIGKDEVVNWTVGKDCSSMIEFEDDYGKIYTIARFRKHNENGNSLFLFQDNQNLTQSTVLKTQEEIEKILGMNWLVFSVATLFGERARRFSEAVDSEKKQIFDEILMFHQYLDALSKVKEDIRVVENEVSATEQMIITYNKLIEENTSKIAQYEEDLVKLENDYQKIGSELEYNTKKIQENTEKLDKLKEVYNANLKIKEELESDDQKLMQYMNKLENEKKENLSDPKNEIEGLKAEINVLLIELNNLDSSISKLDSFKFGTRCPTCGHEFNEESVADVRNHFKNEKEKKESVYTQYVEKLSKLEDIFEQKNNVWEEKISATVKSKMELEKTLSDLRDSIMENKTKIFELESEIKSFKFEIEQVKTSYDEKVEYVNEQIDIENRKLKENINEIEKFNEIIENKKDELQYLKFWKDGFGNQGIKSLLLDEIVPMLNNKVSYYASALMDNSISVEFDTETTLKSGEKRDKFDIRLIINGDQVDYKNCSSGEKRRIDVSILLALQNLIFSRNINSSNLIIFDEVFDSLDRIGIERVINLLEEESKDKSIFVISHIQELADYFKNVILIKNKNGISSLEVQY